MAEAAAVDSEAAAAPVADLVPVAAAKTAEAAVAAAVGDVAVNASQ